MPLLEYPPRVSLFETRDRQLCSRTQWRFPHEGSRYTWESRMHKLGALRHPDLAKKRMLGRSEGRLSDAVSNLPACPNPGLRTAGTGFRTASLPTLLAKQLRQVVCSEGHSSESPGGLD